MRIALAEDELYYANTLRQYLHQFGQEHQLELEIIAFSSGAQLVEQFRADWDLILLDIDMPGLNGLETARTIRHFDPEVLIVFITNLAQYAINGYEFNAFDYLLKPVQYPFFSMKMELVLRQLRQRSQKSLLLNRDGELFRLPLGHIRYIEIFSHRLLYHTINGDIEINSSSSLSQLEQELQPEGFVRCHKSLLVNTRYIEHIKGGTLTVSGIELPVSRSRRKALVLALLERAKGGIAHEGVAFTD